MALAEAPPLSRESSLSKASPKLRSKASGLLDVRHLSGTKQGEEDEGGFQDLSVKMEMFRVVSWDVRACGRVLIIFGVDRQRCRALSGGCDPEREREPSREPARPGQTLTLVGLSCLSLSGLHWFVGDIG